jgi:hypothetical protein
MSTEALLKALADRRAQFSRAKTIKPNPPRSRYRILPSWRKTGNPEFDAVFWQDFGQHFIKDAAGAMKAVYICTDKTFGRPCEVCNIIAEGIRQSPDDATTKRLEDARAGHRVLLNVLWLDGPTPTTPEILEIAPSVFNGRRGVGGIVSLFTDWPKLLDPVEGMDIVIEKSGTGFDTTYSVAVVGGGKPVPPEALSKLHDLDEYVKQESEQAAKRAITSVASISGLMLPAPTPAYVSPMAPAASLGDDTMMFKAPEIAMPVAAPVGAPIVTAPVDAAPVPVAPVAATAVAPVAPAVAPQPAPVAPVQPALASTGDPELDALLKGL